MDKVAHGGQGVGAAVLRLEDGRFFAGRGEYLADLQIPGTLEVAFLRSPVAHAVLNGVRVPDALRGKVFLADDIGFAKPIVATGGAPGFKRSEYPPLARGKVRFVGEMIAMCIGRPARKPRTSPQACELDLEELPALWDLDVALKARRAACA